MSLIFFVRIRRRVAWLTCAAAAASLIATAIFTAVPSTAPSGVVPGVLGSLEALVLLTLIVLTVRVAPVRQAVVAGSAAHLAVSLWVLRSWSHGSSGRTVVGGCAFWSLCATGAVAAGVYARVLDERRRAAVAEARRGQRLDLARDLHDFVAHDVSEMVAQAQAGRYVGESDPQAALEALRRIENAGLRAMTSLDRTVHMLHADSDSEATAHPHTMADLPELVEAAGSTVRLELDPSALDDAPRDVSATAYRIVVEALTNVRRHAPGSEDVHVEVGRERDTLTVLVTNSCTTPRSGGRVRANSGLGLPGLTERVEALGGTFRAGPDDQGRWRLVATLPCARLARAHRTVDK